MSTSLRARRRNPARRPWKRHKSGVTPQLRQLVDEAGGQTAFARKVWGGEVFGEHKGKVAKWYYGRSGISLPEARRVAAKLDTSVKFIMGGEAGEVDQRYPWMPSAWTPEVSQTFALDYFRASAAQLLAERAEKLETLRRLADVAGDDGLADEGIEDDIRGKVSALAAVWLSEVHNKVRDVVDGEINGRIAMHLSKGRKPRRPARRARGR